MARPCTEAALSAASATLQQAAQHWQAAQHLPAAQSLPSAHATQSMPSAKSLALKSLHEAHDHWPESVLARSGASALTQSRFYYWRALLGHQLGAWEQAQTDVRRALACALDSGVQPAQAYALMGEIPKAQGQYAEAVAAYERALEHAPSKVNWRYNLALCLEALGEPEAARDGYEAVLRQAPDHGPSLNNVAALYQRAGLSDKAEALWTFALSVHPQLLGARVNRALLWLARGEGQRAQAEFEAALKVSPTQPQALLGLAAVHRAAARHEAVLECLERAFAVSPNEPFVLGQLLMARLQLADWGDFAQRMTALAQALDAGQLSATPFSLLALIDDPALHALQAKRYVAHLGLDRTRAQALPLAPAAQPRPRIRVGYFSADLHEHATAYLMAELFERHDREAFEVFVFSYGKHTGDAAQQRMRAAVEHWIDGAQASDEALVAWARAHALDLAIDLKGYTYQSRPALFAQRLAPVQVSYLGYPGTLGGAFMDYVLVDRVIAQAASDQAHYSEQLVRLPQCYQVNDSHWACDAPAAWREPGAVRSQQRQAHGLDPAAMVYCCFNNTYKILPGQFDQWMAILQQVPRSQLWLLEDSAQAEQHLRKAAQSRGIDPQRLVFAPRVARPEHLRRHVLADLFLDTFPYNAHTTASDALRCGLPLLTRAGRSFASRVSASLLQTLGLESLITHTPEAYAATALAWACDATLRCRVQKTLAHGLAHSQLFHAEGLRPSLEAAYAHMVRHQRQGLAPRAFDVTIGSQGAYCEVL